MRNPSTQEEEGGLASGGKVSKQPLARRSALKLLSAMAASPMAIQALLAQETDGSPANPDQLRSLAIPSTFRTTRLQAALQGQGSPVTVQKKSPFFEWMDSEGIPLYTGYAVDDVGQIKVTSWKRLGSRGAMIYLAGDGGLISAYVCEIAPGKQTLPEKHMYDERILALSGSGETRVWQQGKNKVVAKWKAGTFFAMPLNAWHEHVNTGETPARLIAAIDAPLIIDTYRNLDYIFGCDFEFTDRFNSQGDFFAPLSAPAVPPKGRRYAYSITNLVPDVYNVKLYPAGHELVLGKGVGTLNHHFVMASDTMDSHVEEWQPGVYEAGHRHGPGAQVMFLKGHGYSLMWPQSAGTKPFAEGHGDQVVRVDWHPMTLFVPGLGWYHQHFNTSPTPVRMIKLGEFGSRYYLLTARGTFNQVPVPIPYKDEDPKIREMFAFELKKNGVPLRMPSVEALANY